MYSIQIRTTDNPQDRWIFERNFDSNEPFQEVKSKCDAGARTVGLLESWFYPVRTHEGFWQDLFLPGVFNHALKVNSLAVKILLVADFFLIDMLTLFLFRIFTVLPRCIYNRLYGREQHPLYLYLSQHYMQTSEDRPELLNSDYVWVKLQYREGAMFHTRENWIKFIPLPDNALPSEHTYSNSQPFPFRDSSRSFLLQSE